MVHPSQIRAARVLIDLSQEELAKLAGIGVATLRRVEAVRDEISGNARSILRIQRALEEAGVEFIDQDDVKGPGVRLRAPLP